MAKNLTSQLVLGTAQLGLPYGVANSTGQLDRHAVVEIVRAAWEGGIREFDTAQEYGRSEEVLGQAFRELEITNEVRVISKLAKDIDLEDEKAVISAVEGSLVRLGVRKLFALLLHKEELLDMWGKKVVKGTPLRELVQHLGVSVYSPSRALQALATDDIDMVQIPANILDQRFEKAGVFTKAEECGKVLYVRSIFLQGLLLMKPDVVPSRMAFARPMIEQVRALALELGLSNLELALGYIKKAFPLTRIVVGAETAAQISEITLAWRREPPSDIIHRVHTQFPEVDRHIMDPRLWPKNS